MKKKKREREKEFRKSLFKYTLPSYLLVVVFFFLFIYFVQKRNPTIDRSSNPHKTVTPLKKLSSTTTTGLTLMDPQATSQSTEEETRSSDVSSGKTIPWTNEKHVHFLNSMEAWFVQTMLEDSRHLLHSDRNMPASSELTVESKLMLERRKKHATTGSNCCISYFILEINIEESQSPLQFFNFNVPLMSF